MIGYDTIQATAKKFCKFTHLHNICKIDYMINPVNIKKSCNFIISIYCNYINKMIDKSFTIMVKGNRTPCV